MTDTPETTTPETEPPRYLDKRAVCFFQGKNGYGQPLPERAAFKPFYAFTFWMPETGVAKFCDIRSACNAALGEMDEGRWLEDFDYWHLGDPAAAEWFEASFITPHLPPWSAPTVTEQGD